MQISLSSCTQKPKTPEQPQLVQFGKVGEQPTEVWKNYNWKIEAL